MRGEIRNSGIDVIGDVTWGTHFCQFYQTKQDLIDTLVPYFKAGLENNEFCMWVTADNLTAAEARKAMTKAMKGFSTFIKKGQIEILSYTEWYLRGGTFNSQNVLNGWIEKLNQALKKGYDGLRLTGDTFWLENKDWHDFTEYEASVNNIIGQYKIIALCTYYLDKCGTTEIVDVIRNHEFTLIKQNGKWELFESSRYKNIKDELKENEKRFRLALKNAPVTVAAQDSDLRFLWAYNQRTVHPQDVLGKTDFEVFPKADAEKLTSLKHRVLQTGKSINKKMWVTSNGRKVYLDLFLEPTKDQSGKIIGIEIATVDLTSQKLVEEALQESEEKYRLIAETSPMYIAISRISDGTILYLNHAYNEAFGYNLQDLVGSNGTNIYYTPADRKRIISQLKRQGFVQNYEVRVKKSDGTPFWVAVSIRPFVFMGEKAMMSASIDITERKNTEEALKESEERFKAIASNTPDHILVQDLDLRYTFVVNPQIGLTEKDMFGKTDYDILKKEDADQLTKIKRQVIATGKAMQLETSVANKKGEMDYFSGSYVPKYNEEGKIDGLIGYFQKITERRKNDEDLIRLNRELRAIRECDQVIVRSSDEISLLTDVCSVLCSTAGYRLAWVGTVEHDEAKSIHPLAWCGNKDYLDSANITWADTERGRGPTGSVARTGKTYFIQDFATETIAGPWLEAALSRGHGSSIAIPLKEYNGNVFAVLCLYSQEPNSFNPAEIRLLEELGNDISFGVSALREKAKRQQAEAEMAHIASFPELNPNPIIEMDGKGHITYMNPAAKEQLPDFSTSGLKHPFLVYGKALAQRLKDDPAHSINRQIQVEESWYEQTLMYVPAKNTYRLYARDITKSKKAEDVLKESEERNRLILATTLDGVWINDLSGRLLYVNDAYCHMIGYTREELLKMYIHDIEAKEKQEETNEHINKIIRRGGDIFETRHKRKDGRIIDIEISAKYINTGNGQFIVFARNITERKKFESQMKSSEERFSKAFHSSPVALSISRIADGEFIDVNQSFLQLFGYQREEIIGQKATELNFYDNPKDRNETVRLLQQEGKVINYEVTAHTKTGREIRALTSAEKIDVNGLPHIIWTTIDITEHQQAEDLLRETSNYLNNLLDYANAPIIVWDSRFRISRFNPAFERLTGYKSGDVIGLDLGILFPENKKSESMELIQLTLAGERWDVVEIPIARVDGEIRTVLWNSANVYDTAGKTIIATIAQGQDITERKRAELGLKETSDYLNNLINYANAPIIVWDPEFHITRFNHAFERLTSISAGEAIGKSLDILFPEDSKTHSMEHIRSTVSGERWEVVEIPILQRNGAVRIVLWNSATLVGADGKKVVATIAQGQDITERKQAEEEIKNLNEELKHRATELEAANKELEAFSYSVSHDLRAPLRSIEGFSQALQEDCKDILNDECKNYLSRIQNSAELMAQLIDDLLRLSRITRADMDMEKISLTEIARNIAARLKNDEPKRNVKFVVTPELTAYGDGKLIGIMMGNLFENAWKFTRKAPEAQIEFGVTEREGQRTYFVRDNGVGFDMKYADKLFKPFQRLHSIDEFPGTGIGLASVQRIVQRHGGRVWAEGKTGEGATVYFTLE